jgi:hypothetical protein
VVLVSRESFIRASGEPGRAGQSGFDLSDGTRAFGRFAEDVSSGEDVGSVGGEGGESGPVVGGGPLPAFSEAHQYSVPGVMEAGPGPGPANLQGAFAEGSVRADLNAPGATAWAVSNFDLTFRVVDAPSAYTFGAAVGISGSSSTLVELLDLDETGALPPAGGTEPIARRLDPLTESSVVALFTEQLDPSTEDSRTIEHTGLLEPGLYALRVHADSDGTPEESSAYYNVNLTFAPPPLSVPLPAAAWPGLGGLLALVAGRGLHAFRRRRRQ